MSILFISLCQLFVHDVFELMTRRLDKMEQKVWIAAVEVNSYRCPRAKPEQKWRVVVVSHWLIWSCNCSELYHSFQQSSGKVTLTWLDSGKWKNEVKICSCYDLVKVLPVASWPAASQPANLPSLNKFICKAEKFWHGHKTLALGSSCGSLSPFQKKWFNFFSPTETHFLLMILPMFANVFRPLWKTYTQLLLIQIFLIFSRLRPGFRNTDSCCCYTNRKRRGRQREKGKQIRRDWLILLRSAKKQLIGLELKRVIVSRYRRVMTNWVTGNAQLTCRIGKRQTASVHQLVRDVWFIVTIAPISSTTTSPHNDSLVPATSALPQATRSTLSVQDWIPRRIDSMSLSLLPNPIQQAQSGTCCFVPRKTPAPDHHHR